MGRYYGGDIEGKFWFGVQSSVDARHFGADPEESEKVYSYCGDSCPREAEEGDPCPNCGAEEECQATMTNEVWFHFDADHMDSVESKRNELEQELLGITQRWQEVLEKLAEGWDVLEMDGLVCEIGGELTKAHAYNELAARYLLGTQIARCLTAKGSCSFWCEL